MHLSILILCFVTVGIKALYTEDNVQQINKKESFLNSFLLKTLPAKQLSLDLTNINTQLLEQSHRIVKRNAYESSGRRSKRRRKRRKRPKHRNYHEDTNKYEQKNYRKPVDNLKYFAPQQSTRDDLQHFALQQTHAPRDNLRSFALQQTDAPREALQYFAGKPKKVQSKTSEKKGLLRAKEINAGKIDAVSMKADTVTADAIYADRIQGDIITVTSKRRPSMSEFMHNNGKNYMNGKRDSSNDRIRYRPTDRIYENPRPFLSYAFTWENEINRAQLSPSNSGQRKASSKKKYLGSKKKILKHDLNRRNRKIVPSYQFEETIIDTSNHPFISFQNGYVKRRRIKKPGSLRTYRKRKKTIRNRRRKYGIHPSYWG